MILPSTRDDAADLIYNSIGAVPHEQFGTINIMPFMAEDETTNALKRAVAEGLADVLESGGVLAPPATSEAPTRSVRLQCRSCSTVLLTASVSDGVANIAAGSVIDALGKMSHACPHEKLDLESQRRMIQDALEIVKADGRN